MTIEEMNQFRIEQANRLTAIGYSVKAAEKATEHFVPSFQYWVAQGETDMDWYKTFLKQHIDGLVAARTAKH